MDLTFNYHDQRASKARLRTRLDKTWRVLLTLLVVTAAGLGVLLVLFQVALGWLIIGLAFIPLMIVQWWHGELRYLSPDMKNETIAARLDPEILGQLKPQSDVADIASIIGTITAGQFFGARFGLSSRVLQDLASHEDTDINKLWSDAASIRESIGEVRITAGMLIAAIIKQFPNYQSILAHIHIDYDDLIEGIKWQLHLDHLIRQSQTPRRTGGIARDWSFGYTPMLARFGRNISVSSGSGLLNVETDSHQKALAQLVDTFGSGGAQNVVLVGPAGVGKTTLVSAFAEKLLDASSRLPVSLKFRQIIMLDANTLISAAPGRGQIEELVIDVLSEAFAAKNIIICLDNAQLFFEEGVGSVDITNVLLPILEAGRLKMILAMDEQRFLQISRRNPTVANTLNRVSIAPATENETLRVMQDQLILTEFKRKVTFTYQSLIEIYRLSSRYVHDVAMPGQALKLLESSAGYSEQGLVTINSVQQAIEQTLDIKVSVASESEDREKLLNLETLIHKRMINQSRAVSVVSDALRRARAGVRNQNRPIGTFLFLGPTGVGKTELAKALADVYFGGEGRMIRLDLNEYVRNEDVSRLIADGADDPSSLTAQVMKQPYSVILLDEIEKAHPNVLTTLLQLLDEGILRDINNHEVSFRDTIVISTSNAGSERIREYAQRGYNMEEFEQQFVDELISTNQFRPEFLNRFDEIVLFTPLSKPDLLKVVDLMIVGVNATLANQKVSVQVSEEAKLYLVERGYDPRLGARPMRRVVQKAVENTVAKSMLKGEVEAGGIVDISLDQVQSILGSSQQAAQIVQEGQNPAQPTEIS